MSEHFVKTSPQSRRRQTRKAVLLGIKAVAAAAKSTHKNVAEQTKACLNQTP
jgi:hypothetical protein